MGRYYEEEDGFRYILQIHECEKTNRSKVKIRKWMDTPDMEQYDAYIADWHAFLSKLRTKLEDASSDLAKSVSMYILQRFYLLPYDSSRDFYSQYEARMAAAKEWSENL